MVCSMCYYGLAMNQVNLGNDIYVSFALGGVVEIVGYLFAYFTIDHMGRKTILIFCQIVAGIACIVGGVLDDDGSNVVLTLSLIGKWLNWLFSSHFFYLISKWLKFDIGSHP